MVLIKLPMAPCLPILLPILRSSSPISMDIFAMSSSLALSPTVLVLSVISLFTTKTLWRLILILLFKRNPIPLTKINVFTIQNFWFQHSKTPFPNIDWSILKYFLVMQLSIPYFIRAFLLVTLLVITNISGKLIFRWMHNPDLKIRIIPSRKMVFHSVLMILRFPWNQKAANQTYEAAYLFSSSSAQKWNGSTTKQLKSPPSLFLWKPLHFI